jgi:hypothetical protein
MATSRKDYVAIAAIIAAEARAQSLIINSGRTLSGLRNVARGIAEHFAKENPRFDTAKFLAAAAAGVQ